MKFEPLFLRFDELTDGPERIPALRKLILAFLLHSAVRSPDALSCAQTLREANEKKIGELKKRDSGSGAHSLPEVTAEDLPPGLSDIPVSLFDRLGNITSIEKGLSQIQRTKPGAYPLVVTAETRSSSTSYDFEGPATIIPMVSSTGHGDASLKRIHYQEGHYAVGNILAVVQPICPGLIRARFIYEYLFAFKEELLVSRMVGTANVSLTINKLKEVPIPLVTGLVLSRIDELMTLCDRLGAQLQERETRNDTLASAALTRFTDSPTSENLNLLFHPSIDLEPADLRKTILSLAVQGRLVPQAQNEPGPEGRLIELYHIKLDYAKKGKLRATKVPPNAFINESLPFIPKSWRTVGFDHLANPDNNALKAGPFGSALKKEFYVPKGYKIYGQEQVIAGDPFFGNYYIDKNKFAELLSCAVAPGDILISLVGTIGKVLVLPESIEEGIINPRLLKFSLDLSLVYPQFIKILLGSSYVIDYFEEKSHGGTMNILNLSILRELPIPLPPIAEQRRIVAKVDQLISLIDQYEAQLTASRKMGEKLLSAMVAELTAEA
jgi:type I restriction enzyme, S subunit